MSVLKYTDCACVVCGKKPPRVDIFRSELRQWFCTLCAKKINAIHVKNMKQAKR